MAWEYFILKGSVGFKANVASTEEDLNKLGAQGWEAVSAVERSGSVWVLMKRALAQ